MIKIKNIIELENGKFACFEQTGDGEVEVIGVEDPTHATMWEDDVDEVYNELFMHNNGWLTSFSYYGECTVPKKIRQVEIKAYLK